MSDFDDAAYERDFPREAIRVKAEILIDGHWHHCVITNISPSGARLYGSLKVSRGLSVSLKVGESGRFGATVVWIQADEIGLKFSHDPSEMSRLLSELGMLS